MTVEETAKISCGHSMEFLAAQRKRKVFFSVSQGDDNVMVAAVNCSHVAALVGVHVFLNFLNFLDEDERYQSICNCSDCARSKVVISEIRAYIDKEMSGTEVH